MKYSKAGLAVLLAMVLALVGAPAARAARPISARPAGPLPLSGLRPRRGVTSPRWVARTRGTRATAIADAVPLPASPVAGSIAAENDEQWYSVDLTKGQTIRLKMTAGASTDFDLYVLDADGTTELGASELYAYPEDVTFTAQSDGTYFVVASSYRGSGAFTIQYKINRRLALLVGISDYPGTYSDLRAPVPDVDDVARMLVNVCDFYVDTDTSDGDDSNVRMLLDSDATTSAIHAQIAGWLANTQPGDEVMFYYSGHGDHVPDVSGDETDGQDETIVAYNGEVLDDTLASWFGSVPATQVVLGFDSCFSGGMVKAPLRPGTSVRTIATTAEAGVGSQDSMHDLAGSGRLVLTASDANELSVEVDTLKNGLFTFFFTQAMTETAANTDKDSYVSMQEAFTRAKTETVAFMTALGDPEYPPYTPQIADGIGTPVEWAQHPALERLYGADRYQTAIQVAWHDWPATAPTVVLATGAKFPDALCAAPLANVALGPVLLVPKGGLDTALKNEIARLSPATIYIIGSGKTVPTGTEAALAKLFADNHIAAPQIIRRQGDDRYKTAAAVAREVQKLLGGGRTDGAVLATGLNFPDALSAAPFAAAENWPILLTDPKSMSSDTKSALSALNPVKTMVVGDTSAVSDAVMKAAPRAFRIGRSGRYRTAAAVTDWELSHGLTFQSVALATGEDFPDALAAGPMIGYCDGPVVLSSPSGMAPEMTDVVTRYAAALDHLDAIGGLNSMPDPVVEQFLSAAQTP